eukprot:scaffold1971_cov374-Prasinococcus_capsulatus_cf.AAC.8
MWTSPIRPPSDRNGPTGSRPERPHTGGPAIGAREGPRARCIQDALCTRPEVRSATESVRLVAGAPRASVFAMHGRAKTETFPRAPSPAGERASSWSLAVLAPFPPAPPASPPLPPVNQASPPSAASAGRGKEAPAPPAGHPPARCRTAAAAASATSLQRAAHALGYSLAASPQARAAGGLRRLDSGCTQRQHRS